jgi:hypothetical protein
MWRIDVSACGSRKALERIRDNSLPNYAVFCAAQVKHTTAKGTSAAPFVGSQNTPHACCEDTSRRFIQNRAELYEERRRCEATEQPPSSEEHRPT